MVEGVRLMFSFLLLGLMPSYNTIAPPVSVTCQVSFTRLWVDTAEGRISPQDAASAFMRCQQLWPPLAPDQPVDYL